jgi:anti-anti-sigma regulatory factor
MTDALEIQREITGEVAYLKLKGRITEDSHLEGLSAELRQVMILDLAQIERINSYGIRQWINALKDIRQKIGNLIFTNVPPVMVEQFNMISNFGAGGTVYSFHLPYFCESCDIDEQKVFELQDGKTPQERPTLKSEKCAKCGSELVLNDIEEEYLSFLQYQKGHSIPSEALAVIRKHA